VSPLQNEKPNSRYDMTAKKKKGTKTVVQWDIIEQDYFNQNLAIAHKFTKEGAPLDLDYTLLIKKGFNLKHVAEKYGLALGTVRNKASDYHWRDRLRNKIAEINENTADEAKEVLELDITSVRKRQATMARLAASKAAVRLQDLNVKELSVPDLINMLKMGLEQERKALGIPDKVDVRHEFPLEDGEFPTVADHIASHSDKHKLLQVIVSLMQENKQLSEKNVIDVK